FIKVNSAALPASLIESELFGHERGAFTGADRRRIGRFELADGGTLFLDEITEIDLATQAKLLKVLDTKRFRRLGGDKEISVDVRVVAATNREMRQAVHAGEFRKDLYYRLNVVEISIPPLRDRREDTDLITAHYFELFRRKFNKPDLELSADSWELIREYGWPGNVRELINVLERAVLLSTGSVVQRADLPIEKAAPRRQAAVVIDDAVVDISIPDDGVSLDRVEKRLIEETLKRSRGNVSKAATMLRISRGALRNKLDRHGIDPVAFRGPILVES
ncbi:MAG: sigma-54-dependent Fis family transcriptional regulator, partial [Candidatus Krumholzibacteria bacterium]|nr:sigma-54-dependent Fis family transcriptional regulator [Candidatus Krumholzibacteria bacterium]